MLGLKRSTSQLFAAVFACSLALVGCDKGAPASKPNAAPNTSTNSNAGTPKTDGSTPTPAPAPSNGGENTAAGDEILIGHYASMTGSEATFGESTDNGIKLAVKEINAAGGINGKKVKLITHDTKSDSREAGNAVTRLVTQDKVVAVLGEVASSRSLAGAAVCKQYNVPMITPSSTNVRVTTVGNMIYRVCFTDDQQTYALAKFIRENLKFTKAAVLFDQTQAYSQGVKDDFTKSFKEMGGEIVSEQPFNGNDQDFSAQLNTIKAANPQIILIPGYYTEGGNIALQARKLGVTCPLIGGDGWDSEQLVAIGKDAIEGCYYSNHSAPDQPDSNIGEFITKYKADFGGKTPDALGGLGYDAAMVLFEAMKRSPSVGGSDLAQARADVTKALSETKDFKGVTGTINFDKNRNAQKPIVIVQIKGGKPSWVANVQPK